MDSNAGKCVKDQKNCFSECGAPKSVAALLRPNSPNAPRSGRGHQGSGSPESFSFE